MYAQKIATQSEWRELMKWGNVGTPMYLGNYLVLSEDVHGDQYIGFAYFDGVSWLSSKGSKLFDNTVVRYRTTAQRGVDQLT